MHKKREKKNIIQKITGEGLKRSFILHGRAIKAFDKDHYFESAIIYFQLVEICLRVAIHLLMLRTGVLLSTIDKVEDEQSFYRLALYLDLLRPGNDVLSNGLFSFNQKRNEMMHKLFLTTKALKSFDEDLKKFCLEAKKLANELLFIVQGTDEKEDL